MSTPIAPKLTKGAIVALDPFNPLTSIIIFQYNPKTVSHQLHASTAPQSGTTSEALRLGGAPQESFGIEVEIDAADQLEKGDPLAATLGIYPQIAALELLLYPKSAQVITNTALLAAGITEVIPPMAPFTLFVWGFKRVVPVRLDGFTITEQEFDPSLNPVRASANLSLKVLSYNDFNITHPGFSIYLAHQVAKEVMGTIRSVANGVAAGAAAVDVEISF